MLSHRHTVSPSVDVEADTPLSPRRRRRRPRRCALCCVLTVLAAVVFASITLATLPEEEQQMDEGAAPLVTTEGIGATLATQASSDRVWLLRFLCARWSGPISVAVVGDQSIATEAVCGSSKPHPSASVLRAKIDQSLRWRGALLLGTTTTMQLFSYAGNYPINALRNAALNAITTSHVLVVDVDFFPSTELHEAILAQSL